jgi:NADPH:quinone reductase-like Zn-dependent oxidoreductase
MKAVLYQKGHKPDPFVLSEVEKPVPNDDEMLVKIIATSINAYDYRVVQVGLTPKSKILGTDISGQIEAIGKNIQKFKVGDEVFGDIAAFGCGGFAEYVALSEKAVSLKPANISFEEAAAIGMAALTALQALQETGNIQSGHKVLVVGAGGGVGNYTVQFAKYFGAEVTAVCGTQNVELIKSLGADRVIDYAKEDFTKSDVRYDLVLGVNGGYPLASYKRLLTPKGIFVMVGGKFSQLIPMMLFGKLMSTGSKKLVILSAIKKLKDEEFAAKLIAEGKVKSVIDRRYPLEEASQAMVYLKNGHARGKIIINVAQP